MGKWKPVPIDSDALIQDIDGLIGIEVLEPDDDSVVKGKVRLGYLYLFSKFSCN